MVHKWGMWKYAIFAIILVICSISNGAFADDTLTLSDISLKITVNGLETLPLGNIPPETITGSVLVSNNGENISPPYNVVFSLISRSNKERIVDLISRPGEEIQPGSSQRIFLTTARPQMLIPDQYYLKVSLQIDGNLQDSIISSSFGSLGGGTRDASIIPVYKGHKITKPGYYLLQQDISSRDTSAVFEISCEDVTLDGNGFLISGPTGSHGETNGVLVSTGVNKPLRRITIKDVSISGFTNGIWLFDVSDAKILNTHISQADKFGIRLDRVRSSLFSGNVIKDCLTGIGAFKSYGNTFTDNLFQNKNNVIVNEKMKNAWSIDPVQEMNVLGKMGRSGNIWLSSDGGGFSRTATDSDGDGFSDTSFALDADNIDYYPLVYAADVNTEGTIEETKEPILAIIAEPDLHTKMGPITNETLFSEQQVKPSIKNDAINLSVIAASGSEQICRGEVIEVTATVKNNSSVVGEFDLYYYISSEPKIHTNSRIFGTTSLALKPDEEQVITSSFTIPEGYIEGKYYLGVIADPYETLTDPDRTDNVYMLKERVAINPCNEI